MHVFLKSLFFVFFFSINLFAQLDFIDPSTTPFVTPNLSGAGAGAPPQLTSDSTGQYVYATWQLNDGANNRIQVALSSDFGVTWVFPSNVPGGIADIPNLSASGFNAQVPQIATDSTGQYVYVTWRLNDGANDRVQVAISSDFGVTWVYPSNVPAGIADIPNLSASGFSAQAPQIATDPTGANVYVTWQLNDGANDRVQVAISPNFGNTWVYPLNVPGGIVDIPNLSVSGFNATNPQITAAGANVYVTWQLVDGSGFSRIQIARSIDLGANWVYPSNVPGGIADIPNLSASGFDAITPQITAAGANVYVTWQLVDGSGFFRIQIARSIDLGDNWVYPSNVPGGIADIPNLSAAGFSSNLPQITTDSTGQNVYVTWFLVVGPDYHLQVARSSDYGDNWLYPASTPTGTPSLTITGHPYLPQIATDSTGANVCVAWYLADNNVVQAAFSANHGVNWLYPASTPSGIIPNLSDASVIAAYPQVAVAGANVYILWWTAVEGIQVAIGTLSPDTLNILHKSYKTELLLQIDFVNELFWNSLVDAIKYKIYFNSPKNLVYEGVIPHFFHHGASELSTYFVTWVNDVNVESAPTVIHISQ